MRLYLKLLVAIAVFVFAAQLPSREMIAELAFEARVAYVGRFGNAADFEALLDDTQRVLAARRGELDAYLCGKRFQQLMAERVAIAECTEGPLSEDDLFRIRDACEREAFAPLVEADRYRAGESCLRR